MYLTSESHCWVIRIINKYRRNGYWDYKENEWGGKREKERELCHHATIQCMYIYNINGVVCNITRGWAIDIREVKQVVKTVLLAERHCDVMKGPLI